MYFRPLQMSNHGDGHKIYIAVRRSALAGTRNLKKPCTTVLCAWATLLLDFAKASRNSDLLDTGFKDADKSYQDF